MKLISATVRNYRIHRETTVDFDESRTLIGGPNEIGKSTFIEAVHRALFLRPTVTGEARASMDSTLWPGHPEVEVQFSARGDEYLLVKRFAGQNGTVRLTMVGGPTWQGEEAHARLASLLGYTDVGSGRGVLERVAKQWGHLWVWQGKSGEDPANQLAAQQASLFQQLQQGGGAVIMQSALDAAVASRFARLKAESFTANGAARKGSALELAQRDVACLQGEVVAARARVEELREAVRDYEEAEAIITASDTAHNLLAAQLEEVQKKNSELEELRAAEARQSAALAEAQDRLAALEEADKTITELECSLKQLQESLRPREEELQQAEKRCRECRRSKEEAEQQYDRLLAATRVARLQKELAESHVKHFNSETRLLELRTRLAHVMQLREKLGEVQAELARLPGVSEEDLDALTHLENERGRAVAALNAMATEIEVVATGQPVRVGDTSLATGDRLTITNPTEVAAGAVRIKVYPGGGDSLAEAREQVRVLGEELQGMLDRHGLSSVQEAAEVAARRKDKAAKEESLRAALREWDPEGLEQALTEAERAREAARAEVERRLQQVVEAGVDAGVAAGIEASEVQGPQASPAAPASEAEALDLLRQAEARLRATEVAAEEARSRRDELREQLSRLEVGLDEFREALTEGSNRLVEWQAQLRLLVANHGPEGMRRRLLSEARAEYTEAARRVAVTRADIEALQPALLQADQERLQRALDEAGNQKRAAETRMAVSRERLRSEGTSDPAADLSSAEGQLALAQERLSAVARRAAAIDLIDNLFRQEQQALADQFSRPLAEKITAYIQCLFGQEAKVQVSFDGNSFQRIELVRGSREGATEFSALSGGAREQVAAAVRLAMAEILAAEHDGALPVVFDDSFAYSDPERVQTLQRMLDLASRKGLQIIVLTCNPADYAGLGARQTILRTEG